MTDAELLIRARRAALDAEREGFTYTSRALFNIYRALEASFTTPGRDATASTTIAANKPEVA